MLADVALAGFAAELAPARFLCNETFEIREPGAVADVLRNALEAQCGASAARAARRENAKLPSGRHHTDSFSGTTQLMRASARGEDARVRQLRALGAPLGGRGPRWGSGRSALEWARFLGRPDIVEDLLLASKADELS